MVNYNQRLVEVDVILNHLSDSDYNKIPQEVIRAIKDNMDKEYTWELDKSKPLEEQELSRDTIAFLSYINMEYLLNDKQKEYMQKLHEKNEQENQKQEYSNDIKSDYNDLFKRNNKVNEELKNTDKIEETALVEYKESFFKKMINKIKSFFRRKTV